MMRRDSRLHSLLVWTTSAVSILAAVGGCGKPERRIAVRPAPEPVIRQVADRVLHDFPQPPPFDWGEGVLMAGMMRAGLVLNDPRYITFARTWADHWRGRGLTAVLAGAPDDKIRGYCGHWGPGYPVILLYEETREPAYLAMCREIAHFIMTRATRTRDGGLGHWEGNHQLWVDTLYMVCPLFSHMTRVTGDPALVGEAARQLSIYARCTQDSRTGLFWHMYDDAKEQSVGAFWGRGNGWVAMSYVEVLQNLDRRSPEFDRMLGQFRHQLDGLLGVQDRQAHLWHTVVDRPETYLETSASAMILFSLTQAERLNLYKVDDNQTIPRTWSALAGRVDTDGRVVDVSGGTMPDRIEAYASKIRGTYTWGTGAFLLAASALQEQR